MTESGKSPRRAVRLAVVVVRRRFGRGGWALAAALALVLFVGILGLTAVQRSLRGRRVLVGE